MRIVVKKITAVLMAACLLVAVLPSGVVYANDITGTESESTNSAAKEEVTGSETSEESDALFYQEDSSSQSDSLEEEADDQAGGQQEGTDDSVNDEPSVPMLSYQVHVAKKGWLSSVSGGETAGTTGQALQMEAISISLENIDSEVWEGSGITYSTHVRKIGWQSSVSDGQTAGTTGQALQIEAITIALTGPITEQYDVYYRVHSQTYGWLGWAKNGEKAGSVGYAKRIEAIQIVLVEKGGSAPGSVEKSYVYSRVNMTAHSQNIGWQGDIKEGEIAGSVGQKKRLEAVQLQLSSELEYGGNIEYQVYVQSYGWLDWKSNGETAGTVGQAKRIEAIRVKLTGDIANYYDVYYSVHMSKIGWCNYACNGEITGSTDLSKQIEAIRVVLVKKGVDTAPDTSGTKYIEGYKSTAFTYSAQIKGSGSTGTVAQGATLGKTGQSQQLQYITLDLSGNSSSLPAGTIRYATYLTNQNWTGWSTSGIASGSNTSAYGLEAVKIELTGDLANYYDIYYRVHVQKHGWLGWAKNGQVAGTTGIGYRMEAMQVVLVSKDATAPGANENYYTNRKVITVSDAMHAKAMGYSSSTQYLIMVDRDAHKVGIFMGSQGQWEYLYKWDCANGKASTPTVGGVFTVKSKGYYFDSGSSRCYWWTQFYGNYLFHSVLYNKNGTLQDGRVGLALSHGCVRLRIENAKWIYDNVPTGTTVVVY